MPFALPDLIIESVIREGLAALRQDPTPLAETFEQLKTIAPIITKKYGDAEIQRIQKYLVDREISFVTGYALIPANLPCISLLMVSDDEDSSLDHLEDFEEEQTTPITDPNALAALVLADNIVPVGFNANSGIIVLDDSVDLSRVTVNKLFVDASGTEFQIVSVNETPGSQGVGLKVGSQPDITDFCLIKSSINYTQNEVRGTMSRENLRLGVHTEDRLLTIYLYTLVKSILSTRKVDIITRGFDIATMRGSDFARDLEYMEGVFTRFIDLSGKIQDSWPSDQVTPIDNVNVQALVQRDVATNAELGLEGQTVQVDDDSVQED